MTDCEWTDLKNVWHCENQASQMMTYGCIHEHVNRSATCQRCLDYARGSGLICRRCMEHHASPHNCEMRIVNLSMIQSENGNETEEANGAETLDVQRPSLRSPAGSRAERV